MVLHTYLLVLALALVDSVEIKDRLIVKTNAGLVRGKEDRTIGLNKPYYAYQGIPYAEPPIGKLRFENPVPKSNWEGTLNATTDGEVCVQSSNPVLGSENCLFVNVYVPKEPKPLTRLFPTMVFIYGGGFEAGFGTYDAYGPDYLLEKHVAVVTFNYRLGIFGFLSTGDLVAPGNSGLKDQVLALQWVKQNIAAFGGDPDSITLFGQSAGSVSVSYHLQSPKSEGLFHRAIMESGVTLSLWALCRRAPYMTQKTAKLLGINSNDNRIVLDRLKSVDYQALQTQFSSAKSSELLGHNPRDGFLTGPVVEPLHDGAFFTGKSDQRLASGQFTKVPCIVGFNSLEGTFNFGTLFRIFLFQYDLDPSRLVPIDMGLTNSVQKNIVGHLVKKFYFGNDLVATSEGNLLKFLSEDQFVRPTREFVRQVSKYVPVYFYEFSYEGGLWGFVNRTQRGVTHSEELGYIWRSKFNASDADLTTRRRMTTMWTDFAKVGNPTPQKYFSAPEVVWEPANENFSYLEIDTTLVNRKEPMAENMNFWDGLYRSHGVPPYDTY